MRIEKVGMQAAGTAGIRMTRSPPFAPKLKVIGGYTQKETAIFLKTTVLA